MSNETFATVLSHDGALHGDSRGSRVARDCGAADARQSWNDEELFATIDHFREKAMDAHFNKYRVWMTGTPDAFTLFGTEAVEVWYDDPPYYVRIVDVPDALSGDILRYKCDLPRYDCNLEIIGDDFREIDFTPFPKHLQEAAEEEREMIEDGAKELLASLPLVALDEDIHFTKSPRTQREIEVLQICKGSPHFVQLLGRSADGQLVFPKYSRDLLIASIYNRSIDTIRRWMLDIIEGIAYLHARGITYRDFGSRNFLDADPAVICDLECTLASRVCMAPELLVWDDPPDTAFTPASDVYGLGFLLQQLCYRNNPRSPYFYWPVLPPLDKIYEACTQTKPEDRPSLEQLKAWLQGL